MQMFGALTPPSPGQTTEAYRQIALSVNTWTPITGKTVLYVHKLYTPLIL